MSTLNQFLANRGSVLRTFTVGLNRFCDLIPFLSFKTSPIGQQIDLMIDSGSQGNVIMPNTLPPNIRVNQSEEIWIKGTSRELLITLGSVNLKIFNKIIKFHVIEHETKIAYNGILGTDSLNENKVIMDFHNKNLDIDNYALQFKQNGVCGRNIQMNRILNINQTVHGQNLPLIDNLNRQLTYVGQFLLDTGSE